MDLVRITAGDETNKYQRASMVLRTVGWLCIVWGFSFTIWLWMGWKAGSQLWFWWMVGLVVAGVACLVIAGILRRKSAHLAGREALATSYPAGKPESPVRPETEVPEQRRAS